MPSAAVAGAAPGRGPVICEPDPDNPGWLTWNLADTRRFNPHAIGPMIVRREGDRSVRLRMHTGMHHSNMQDGVHGGVILALTDVALFAACHHVAGVDAASAVTVDLSCQFIGGGRIGASLDCVPEVLRETRRMVFLRGIVEQEGALVASFSGVVRKPSAR